MLLIKGSFKLIWFCLFFIYQADCAINLLGKDIKIKNTSIGKAFLAKCPALDQVCMKLSIFSEAFCFL